MSIFVPLAVLCTTSSFLLPPFGAVQFDSFLVDTVKFVLIMFTNFCKLTSSYHCLDSLLPPFPVSVCIRIACLMEYLLPYMVRVLTPRLELLG